MPFQRKALALVGALVASGALVGGLTLKRGCSPLSASGGFVTVSLARLTPGSGKLFCYRERSREKLRFVLARDADGTVRAAFDACRKCYKFHQGFTTSQGYLTCRYCGNRYKLSDIAVGEASCVPVALPTHVEGGSVRISVPDLEAGRWLF
jgi:uncharacterized membrane protein